VLATVSGTNPIALRRTDRATTTSGSATVSDASVLAIDKGRFVTGPGIPANSYVGTVTPGTSFLLSSSPTPQANVPATASATNPIALTDVVVSSIQYWDGSTWQSSCTQPQPPATDIYLNALQLITVTVTHPNGLVTMRRSFVKGPA